MDHEKKSTRSTVNSGPCHLAHLTVQGGTASQKVDAKARRRAAQRNSSVSYKAITTAHKWAHLSPVSRVPGVIHHRVRSKVVIVVRDVSRSGSVNSNSPEKLG